MTPPQLPPDLTYDADGHLSAEALAALADGEAGLLQAGALAHLDGCDHCALGLADAALRSAEVGEILRTQLASRPEAALSPRRLPARWIALGLALAALGALPGLFEADILTRALDLFSLVTEVLPALALRLVVLLRDPGPALAPQLAGSSLIATLVLFAAALVVARVAGEGRLAVSKEMESP